LSVGALSGRGIGNDALFARENALEAAWAVIDPVLKYHHRAIRYPRGMKAEGAIELKSRS